MELKDAGISTSELDSRVLLKHAIDVDETWIIKHPKHPITNAEYSKFRRFIRKRKSGIPVAYIVHEKEFYERKFFVNKNVLIPRPETELIVDEAVKYLKSYKLQAKKLDILDIGTGSGAIIISIAKELTAHSLRLNARFYATDISKKALAVARKNAKIHKVNKIIRFYNSDLFSNKRLPKKFDIILTNLPYVPSSNVKNLPDPRVSLDGGEKGLDVIYKFLNQVKDRIDNKGIVFMEIGFNQSKKVISYAKKLFPNAKISKKTDLQKLDRIVKIMT